MPPRYAYWTILLGNEPTSFRSGSQEELLPTLNRLKQKHPEARMMWWQNGKLWNSRLDAQEAMRARGEMGRAKDFRQSKPMGERRAPRRDDFRESNRRDTSGKLEWKPKGEAAERPPRRERADRPLWNPKDTRRSSPTHVRSTFPPRRDSREELEWKPKGARAPKREWSPKGPRKNAGPSRGAGKPEWRPKSNKSAAGGDARRSAKREGGLEWKPKGAAEAPKRKWVPKEEYKKSQGIEARRDKNWRPGGEHKDPRQKYKDAKKAKWSRFKQNIRQRWDAKQGQGGDRKKRRDEE